MTAGDDVAIASHMFTDYNKSPPELSKQNLQGTGWPLRGASALPLEKTAVVFQSGFGYKRETFQRR